MPITRPLHSGVGAEDLLILLAITRAKTVSGAAERLGVDHSTVSRHVRRMEKRIGQRLFDRTAHGWAPTETGRSLCTVAERIRQSLDDADRLVDIGSADGIGGAVRLLTPEAFGTYLAPRALAQPLAKHSALRIELLTTTRHLDLGAGEYDVAVSLEPPPTRAVVSQRLCTYSLGMFASADYLCDRAPITDVADLRLHPLVYYLDGRLDIATLRVLDELVPGARATMQSNSVSAQIQAVVAGNGIGLLPTYAARFHSGLVPVLPEEVAVAQQYWLVVPTAVHRAPHIRVVADALTRHLADAPGPARLLPHPPHPLRASLTESRKKRQQCPPTAH